MYSVVSRFSNLSRCASLSPLLFGSRASTVHATRSFTAIKSRTYATQPPTNIPKEDKPTKTDTPTTDSNKIYIKKGFTGPSTISDLAAAARKGDQAFLEAHLNTEDIKGVDYYGNTLLHWAMGSKSEAVVKLLVNKGLKVDATNLQGVTPLGFAASCGDEQSVKALLERGADVNVKDKSGHTPLHYAATLASPNIARLLVEKGANVNAKNNDKISTIEFSALHPTTAKYLLDTGAGIDNFVHNLNALHYLARDGHPEVLKMVLEKAATTKKSDGTVYDVEELVEMRCNNGLTPLVYAAHRKDAESVRVLLQKGADPNAVLYKQEISQEPLITEDITPLNYAIMKNNEQGVKAMVEKDAQIGTVALCSAAEKASAEIVELLAKRGKNLQREFGPNKFTLLHTASSKGRLDVVEKLVEIGAKVDATTKDGFTPFMIAAINGQEEVMSFFKEMGLPVSQLTSVVFGLVDAGDVEKIEKIARLGVDLSTLRDENNGTLLQEAAMKDQPEVIEALVESGMDINIRGSNDSTPLFFAVYWARPETVRLFLLLGADVEAQDKEGKTAIFSVRDEDNLQALLDAGAQFVFPTILHEFATYFQFSPERIKKVLELGAKEHIETKQDGYTPLLVSAEFGNIGAFKALLAEGANIKEVTNEGFGVLHLACCKEQDKGTPEGHLMIIEECIKRGIPSGAKSAGGGVSPLAVAAFTGFVEAMKKLIAHGADVNAVDSEGTTALHNAVWGKHVEAVKELLKNGARKDVWNNKGRSPIDFATEGGGIGEIIALLESK